MGLFIDTTHNFHQQRPVFQPLRTAIHVEQVPINGEHWRERMVSTGQGKTFVILPRKMKLGRRSGNRPRSQATVALRFDHRRFPKTSFPGRPAKAVRSPEPGCRPITDWVSDIRQAWASGASNTLSLARLVSHARENLRPGRQWHRLWHAGLSQVPFSKRKAEMLAAIGLTLGSVSAQTFAQMPSGWSTLYHLARLGRRTVERLVGEGTIHPGLTLQEAKTLLTKAQPGTAKKLNRSGVKQRFARFAAFVHATLATGSKEDRRFVHGGLVRLLRQGCLGAAAPQVASGRRNL